MQLSSHMTPVRSEAASPHTRGPGFRAGLGAAAASLAAVLTPALLAWVAAPESSVPWTSAVGIGSAGWFLGHGAPVRAGSGTITLTPLLLTALVLGSAWWGARRAFRSVGAQRSVLDLGVRRDVLDTATGFAGGYGAMALVALLATLAGPAHPQPVWAVLAVLAVIVLAVLGAVGPVVVGGWRATAPAAARWVDGAVPPWARRAVGPAATALAGLAVAASLLVLGMLATHAGAVLTVADQLDTGPVGAMVLVVGQLLLLPNLGLWALAWLAGPGFPVAVGSTVSLTAANPGLMPMVPVLAALPSGGPLPGWTVLAPAVPVLVGVLLGWRTGVADAHWWGGRSAQEVPLRERAATAALAGVVAGLVVAVAAVLGTGGVGPGRLSTIGPPPWPFAVVLVGELLGGALLWLGAQALLRRRRERRRGSRWHD